MGTCVALSKRRERWESAYLYTSVRREKPGLACIRATKDWRLGGTQVATASEPQTGPGIYQHRHLRSAQVILQRHKQDDSSCLERLRSLFPPQFVSNQVRSEEV